MEAAFVRSGRLLGAAAQQHAIPRDHDQRMSFLVLLLSRAEDQTTRHQAREEKREQSRGQYATATVHPPAR